jgi:predicted transposase YdaD
MKIKEVLEALKPHSDDPDMRRVIRMTWVYLANNARYLKRSFHTLLDTFEEVVGEKVMSTLAEMWKTEGIAEGEARGEARGKAEGVVIGEVLTILKLRFRSVPQEIGDMVRSMTDLVALKSLAAHAENCKSLDEFAEVIR